MYPQKMWVLSSHIAMRQRQPRQIVINDFDGLFHTQVHSQSTSMNLIYVFNMRFMRYEPSLTKPKKKKKTIYNRAYTKPE